MSGQEKKKNPNAVALGRLGGLRGGKARADSLTSDRRTEISRVAANARWEKSGVKEIKKPKPLAVGIVIDRSGSMQNKANDVRGGVNQFVADLKADKSSPTNVSMVLFDDRVEVIAENLPVDSVPTLTESNYFVRGSTALLDAVKQTIDVMTKYVDTCKKKPRVLLHISTDGQENASQHTTTDALKSLIEDKKKSGWVFVFCGQDMDAWSTGATLGTVQNFSVAGANTAKSYHTASASANMMRGMSQAVTMSVASGNTSFYGMTGTTEADLAEDETDKKVKSVKPK